MQNTYCTIYLLRNKYNNKVYVGQTWVSLPDRFNNGYGYINCSYLYNAIQKYGKDNFEYEVIAICSDQNIANYLEDCYINFYHSRDQTYGYNIKTGGSNGKLSEETKKKISESLMGVNTWTKGRPVSEETRRKHSQNMIGKNVGNILSDETKKKMSVARKGKPSPNKGKVMSAESKQKMSESQKCNHNKLGKKESEETKARKRKSGPKGKTWKIIDGKRVWISKQENK
jgi:hypothetical protein